MTGITYPDQSTNSFGYYGTGQRAWKVDSAGTSRFVYDGQGVGTPMLGEVDTSGNYTALYTHDDRGLVSQRRSGTSTWYALDDLGNVRDLTNSSQLVTDAYSYKAFGEISASSGSGPNPFTYVGALGYYRETDSGLLAVGARYYLPAAGRFTTRDPSRRWVQGYTYAAADPLTLTDPTGLFAIRNGNCFPWQFLGFLLLVSQGVTMGFKCVPQRYQQCFQNAVQYSVFTCRRRGTGGCRDVYTSKGVKPTCGYAWGDNEIVLCLGPMIPQCTPQLTVIHELIHVGCHVSDDDRMIGGEGKSYYLQWLCGGSTNQLLLRNAAQQGWHDIFKWPKVEP